MRAVLFFLVCIGLSIFCGALLAYPLSLLFEPVLSLEYRKYLRYSTLICGLIFSTLYLKYFRLPLKQCFGYDQPVGLFIKSIIQGGLFGIPMMAIVAVTLQLTGIHVADSDRTINLIPILVTLSGAVLAALAIGFIEESIFRGALFSGLQRQLNAVTAILLTALLYAAVHFIRYPDPAAGTEIHLWTAFKMMPPAFRRFSDPVIIDHFMTLAMFGVLLGLVRLRSSLAHCIGVHAGAVIVIKLTRHYTDSVHGHLLFNRYNDMVGWFTFGVLSLITLLYAWFGRNKHSAH